MLDIHILIHSCRSFNRNTGGVQAAIFLASFGSVTDVWVLERVTHCVLLSLVNLKRDFQRRTVSTVTNCFLDLLLRVTHKSFSRQVFVKDCDTGCNHLTLRRVSSLRAERGSISSLGA